MPAMEKRYPRKTFESKLIKICSRLDEQDVRPVKFKCRYGPETTSRIKIHSLWVVGSFARGARACGDLDLVIQYGVVERGSFPSCREVARSFFGALPLVRYYGGTPQQNSSGIEFPNAVQVWSGSSCDWRKILEGIPINPDAGRASRETDCIPFRVEQLNTTHFQMEYVARLIQEGVLKSEFVPFDDEMLKLLSEEEWGFAGRVRSMQFGKKTFELMPALVRLLKPYDPNARWIRYSISCINVGGSEVLVGRPGVDVSVLERIPSLKRLVIVPHLSGRGPNGAWILSLG